MERKWPGKVSVLLGVLTSTFGTCNREYSLHDMITNDITHNDQLLMMSFSYYTGDNLAVLSAGSVGRGGGGIGHSGWHHDSSRPIL